MKALTGEVGCMGVPKYTDTLESVACGIKGLALLHLEEIGKNR
ncbi:hypothetical protein GCM10010911_58250 [Paenibacillus nasutitermitis]|uniref:Uncharacterized protein n=1 Tax=Paenibacillus nasutitermitis TaxID=1652958 RepID=A0A916ZE84_9BACL|nr:hypothetical protein GCM10010911_58250 [Paenibacillus nasutitermitis]